MCIIGNIGIINFLNPGIIKYTLQFCFTQKSSYLPLYMLLKYGEMNQILRNSCLTSSAESTSVNACQRQSLTLILLKQE